MRKPRPVLVLIDDEPAILEILCLLFEKDFKVYAFSDPVEALTFIKKGESPDFFISDLVMPKMNGLEFVQEARKICPDLPGIILTGNGNSPLLKQVAMLPLVQFSIKPVDLGVLVRMVGLGATFDRPNEKIETNQRSEDCKGVDF